MEDSLDNKTLCVIPTHLFGLPSNVQRLQTFQEKNGFWVVEDASQAMGVESDGEKLGTTGDVGFFSLGRGKNITCGSGGVIVTNSDKLARAISKEYSTVENLSLVENLMGYLSIVVMSVFLHPALYQFPAKLPFLNLGKTIYHKDFSVKKLSGMQAGILRAWKKRLSFSNGEREKNTKYFMKHLNTSLRVDNHNAKALLRLPVIMNNKIAKDLVLSMSNENGFGISEMYPSPINKVEEIKGFFTHSEYPSASLISETLVTAPTHNFLCDKDRADIVRLLNKQETCTS